jgi:uncharacterized membrane protein YbhN (UPF0104 family)
VRARAVLQAIAGVAALALLLQALGLGELRAALSEASPPLFAVFLALTTAVLFVYALRWRVAIRAVAGRAPSLSTLAASDAAGRATAWLVPSAGLGGDPVRALLLRRQGLEWRTAVLAVAFDRVVEMTTNAAVGPLYAVVFLSSVAGAAPEGPWILAGLGAGTIGVATFYGAVLRGRLWLPLLSRQRIVPSAPAAVDAFGARFRDFVRSRSFAAAMGLALAAEALIVVEFVTLTRAFAIVLPLPSILGILVGMGASRLVPIPAALGSLEATQVGVMKLARRSGDLGLAVGLLVRLRETLWLVVGAAYLYSVGLSWKDARSAPARQS